MVSSDLVGIFPAKHENCTHLIFLHSLSPWREPWGCKKVGRDIWLVWVWHVFFGLVGWR